MLIVGYCFGVRSERRLCDEVHLNLAYRWFCQLGLDGNVPDHSTFSKNRHGRFRESDLLRKLFETVVARCMKERLVGGEAFAVDASMIVADAHRRRGVAKVEDLDPMSSRAVAEYLSVLDDGRLAARRRASRRRSRQSIRRPAIPAAANSAAVYAYSDNYLVDLKHAVIMDVEATTAIRQAEVGAAKTMLDRTAGQFDVQPSRLVADVGVIEFRIGRAASRACGSGVAVSAAAGAAHRILVEGQRSQGVAADNLIVRCAVRIESGRSRDPAGRG
jgi:hypothetical protein